MPQFLAEFLQGLTREQSTEIIDYLDGSPEVAIDMISVVAVAHPGILETITTLPDAVIPFKRIPG